MAMFSIALPPFLPERGRRDWPRQAAAPVLSGRASLSAAIVILSKLRFENVISIPLIAYFFYRSLIHHFAKQRSDTTIAQANDVDEINHFSLLVFFKKSDYGSPSIGRCDR
jgi:hypothetical protein